MASVSRSPFFSVVIPTYNRGECLLRAIRSVLAQDFEDFELIVVDDGSEDDTAARVRALPDPRLRLLQQNNRGVSAARNAGAAACRGTWLTFLDSDDEVTPRWLSRLASVAVEGPGPCGILCCAARYRERSGTERIVAPQDLGTAFECVHGQFTAACFAVRREIFEASGGYAETLRYAENTELALRLVRECLDRGYRVIALPVPLVIYNRPGLTERGCSPRFQQILYATEYTLRRHRELLRRDPRMRADYHGVACVNASRLGHYARAVHHAVRAVLASPAGGRQLLRLLLALTGPLARWYWLRHWESKQDA